ncbi:hypothetical protein [Limnoglobus roseus]|uniref:Uncharacterized protein n=1 Tax=Limnoglobus roseus TaxID=2598579 RepID=A0A5C1A9G0_9BACT|nr:hypothetical protein [Limnoglobus roseus]QEL14833.1 hypothetical protein PX52LOC_01731 [Limnoglobus roseus]
MSSINNKRSVSVLSKSPDCPLTCKQLVTYSYMAYQSQFSKAKTFKGLGRYLCFSQDGVSEIITQLGAYGLVEGKDAIDPCPQPDWFVQSDALARRNRGKHWTRSIVNWRYFVRAPQSVLTFSETVVLSLLWHNHLNEFVPQYGYSDAYLVTVTGLSASSVPTAMQGLQGKQFLDRKDGEITLYEMDDEMLANFADPIQDTKLPQGAVLKVAQKPTGNVKVAPTANHVTIDPHTEEMVQFLTERMELLAIREEVYAPYITYCKTKYPGTVRENWPALSERILAQIEKQGQA